MRYQSHPLSVIKDIRPHRPYAIGVGITAAAPLSWPWNVALVAAATIGVLMPSPEASQ